MNRIKVGIYELIGSYNYSTAATDIEVYEDGEYMGTLDGNKYDIDEVSEDTIYDALSSGDYFDSREI